MFTRRRGNSVQFIRPAGMNSSVILGSVKIQTRPDSLPASLLNQMTVTERTEAPELLRHERKEAAREMRNAVANIASNVAKLDDEALVDKLDVRAVVRASLMLSDEGEGNRIIRRIER